MVDPLSQQPLHIKIYVSCIKSFMTRYRMISRAHTGKHRSSPQNEVKINLSIAAHLGTLSGLPAAGLSKSYLSNADETHFVITVDNGRRLWFTGETGVRYADALRRVE